MSEDGSLFGVGIVIGAAFAALFVTAASCEETSKRRNLRGVEACKPAAVLSAGNGVATCSDGRVYRWREGYLTPVGRK